SNCLTRTVWPVQRPPLGAPARYYSPPLNPVPNASSWAWVGRHPPTVEPGCWLDWAWSYMTATVSQSLTVAATCNSWRMSAWRVLTLAGLTSKWFWLAMWITHCLGLLVLPPYSARRKVWQVTKYQRLMLH